MARKPLIVLLSLTIIALSAFSIFDREWKVDSSGEAKDKVAAAEIIKKNADIKPVKFQVIKSLKADETSENSSVKAVTVRKRDKLLKGIASYIRHVNSNVRKTDADRMARCFIKYSKEYRVDVEWIMAIAHTESTYYSGAVSSCMHKGLMQTSDQLAENEGYDSNELFDPAVSIKVGTKYFKAKMKEHGSVKLALTAYNQGSGAVNSGNYSTGYAEVTMERARAISAFLKKS